MISLLEDLVQIDCMEEKAMTISKAEKGMICFWPDMDPTSISVGQVLIANAELPDDLMKKITAAIVSNAERLHDVNAALTGFSAESAPEGLGVEMHPGVRTYFDEAQQQ